jgi:hypothetical protein
MESQTATPAPIAERRMPTILVTLVFDFFIVVSPFVDKPVIWLEMFHCFTWRSFPCAVRIGSVRPGDLDAASVDDPIAGLSAG